MSRREILVGIDLGTTVLKAAAFDAASGRVLAKSVQRLTIEVGPGGAREQRPSALDAALRALGRELRRGLGAGFGRVAGVGFAAQGGSTVVADRRTGRALTPLFLWNDARHFPFTAAIGRSRPAEFWRRRTLRDGPGAGLGRMRWLRETRPALFGRANIYAGAGEYCFFKLTGLWRQDACNALQIGGYHVPRRALDPELLALAGVPLSFVAPVREGHELNPLSAAGARLLGLPAGIPVAGPYNDHEAGYLGAAAVSRRPLQCSLGTAWVGNFALPESARWRSPFQLVLPAVEGAGWLVVQPLLTGNVSWDWALAEFVDRDRAKAIAKLPAIFGRELLPPDGLVALPWFNMPNPLQPGAHGGGAFFGMNPATTGEQLVRALAAAMGYEMLRVFAEVKASGRVDSLVLGGGASKGVFFRQLLAALFAPLPVYRLADEDLSGARGTLHAFSPKACRSRAGRVSLPGAGLRRRIAEGYERYLDVYERIYGGFAGGGPVSFRAKGRK